MTLSVSAFKALAPNDYRIIPVRTHASHNYVYVSGSENSVDVQVSLGVEYNESGLRVENSTYELYDSVMQTFYSSIPYAAYGIKESSYQPTGSVFVISITQDIFGEEITPGSLSVTVGPSQSYDDGMGNLIVSSSGVGSIIGRIFYDKGIAVLQPTSSIAGGGLTTDGICIVNGTNVQIQFSSSVQITEHNVRIKLNPTDFLRSLYNPSVTRQFRTGSTDTPVGLMVSQSLYPYVTSIGLYNQDNELLAVAKLSNPIQRTDYAVQTFVVKFDT